jgi:predicted Zn-dependent protease
MKNIFYVLLLIVLTISCATNPFTGKKTLAFMPNSQLLPIAFAQYDQFLLDNKVLKGTTDADMITRVGERISLAAERWLDANNYQGYLNNYKWEYNLVDDESINAWCMPGGKIVFYSGILPIAAGESGVAAIMGHEVAHALANHGQQRMSAGMIQQLGAAGVAAVTKEKSSVEQDIWMQAYGAGTSVGGMLPFSRSHETEADQIGLYLMAIAGYNPDEASRLWERMKTNSGDKAPKEFLSTHPSNDSRILNLKSLAKDAKSEARKYGVTSFK